jgi:hypothetical protein
MLAGGALILLALAWRYLPTRGKAGLTAKGAEIAELKQDKPAE